MPRYSKVAATLLLCLAIAFDGFHSVVARAPWAGYQIGMNYSSLFLIPLLALALIAIYSEKAILTPMIVFALFGLLTHGVFVAEGGDKLAGFFFMGLAVLSGISIGGLLFGKLLTSDVLLGRDHKPAPAKLKAA